MSVYKNISPMIRYIMPKYKNCLLIFFCFLLFCPLNVLLASPFQREISFSGRTMGTYYSVKIISHRNVDKFKLKQGVDVCLKLVNKSMSCFIPDSELSKFNKIKAGEPFKISNDFYRVMLQSERLFKMTNGAWDGTVKPLVDIWGFGSKGDINKIPDKSEIIKLRGQIGFDKIIIRKNTLIKKQSSVTLDLASIAKGYGVDSVGRFLKESGFKNFVIDIGGEVYAAGSKGPGHPWVIGITRPDESFFSRPLYLKIKLKNKAIATSGDYRNFIKVKGKIFSHIIDPSTGYPIDNGVVSASVIAGTCTFADGLATALMVMGHKKGVALVNSLKNTECLIIVKQSNGTLKSFESTNFKNNLIN